MNDAQWNSPEIWVDVPAKTIAHFPATNARKLVATGDQLRPIRFDLRSFFEIEQPGTYSVQLIGPKDSAAEYPPQTPKLRFEFSPAEAADRGKAK